MVHAIGLGAFLYVLWLLLSGQYTAPFFAFGAVSVALVVVLSLRMDLVDRETHPVRPFRHGLAYWPWLAWQVVRANIAVARVVLARDMRLSPVCVRVRTGQRTALGRVTYANSITLTPGTVSVDMDEETVLVHALRREWAADLAQGEMDRRVQAWEGGA